jgi:putative FmdB family regulatory protein
VPTYQYACTECAERLEAVQKFTDDPLTVCPVCGGRLRKLFSPVGIVFKGSGFYRTDSRAASVANGTKDKQLNGAAADSAAASRESSSSADSEKTSSGDAKPGKGESSGSSEKPGKSKGKAGSGSSSATGTKVA